jgi:hypothetical protein
LTLIFLEAPCELIFQPCLERLTPDKLSRHIHIYPVSNTKYYIYIFALTLLAQTIQLFYLQLYLYLSFETHIPIDSIPIQNFERDIWCLSCWLSWYSPHFHKISLLKQKFSSYCSRIFYCFCRLQ